VRTSASSVEPLPASHVFRSIGGGSAEASPYVPHQFALAARTRISRVQNWYGMLVVTASPTRTALKISQLADGGMPPTYDSMH